MIFIIFFIFLWFECTVTTLPLLLIFLTVIMILRRKSFKEMESRLLSAGRQGHGSDKGESPTLVFALAFFGGLIVDALRVGMIGETSIFLVVWLFLILLYERKYEIATIQFVLVSSFFGSLLYIWIFGYRDMLVQAVAAAVVGVLLFMILRRNFMLR